MRKTVILMALVVLIVMQGCSQEEYQTVCGVSIKGDNEGLSNAPRNVIIIETKYGEEVEFHYSANVKGYVGGDNLCISYDKRGVIKDIYEQDEGEQEER